MVIRSLFSALLIVLVLESPVAGQERPNEQIIKEIEDTFADDILSSKEVRLRRKYFRKNPEAFEKGPAGLFLQHSDPEQTLKTIIGEEKLLKIPERERFQIILALKDTYRRYAYEWLHSNLNTDLKLQKINLLSEGMAVLIVERNMKIVPDLNLKLFVHKTEIGWKVFDFGFWDFRYTRMKRRDYLRYITKEDYKGLKDFLLSKNIKYFSKKL